MKRYIYSIAVVAIVSLAVWAAQYKAAPALEGTNLICYVGTGDTAVTFGYDDAYSTNRTYVNLLGSTVTPKATNSITGGIVPTFSQPIQLWPDGRGEVSDNLAITATVTANAAFTNTVQLFFSRSCNGGTDYDLSPEGTWSFTITPSGTSATIQSTNLSTTFLTGASHVRLWKVVTAANATDNGILTVNRVHVSGYVP